MQQGYTIDLYSNLCSAVTGLETSLEDILTVGERIFNLKRVFNILHGARASDDTLPDRLTGESHLNGESKGSLAKLDTLPEYYRIRGWNPENGWPERTKLKELDMDDVTGILYR